MDNLDKIVELENNKSLGHLILWVAVAFFLIAFVWMYFGKVDEVTVANGTVIPSQHVQLIQNLEGGIVKEILVAKGDIVKKNQPILALDNVRYVGEYEALSSRLSALEIKKIRLLAEVNKQPLIIPLILSQQRPDLALSEKALYDSKLAELSSMQDSANLTKRELDMTKGLMASGSVSEVEVIRLEQRFSDLTGAIATFNSRSIDELSKALSELDDLKKQTSVLKDRAERTVVRAPLDSVVKQMYVTTVGGVVKPGDSLAELVPLDDKLLVEGLIRPSDIAFVRKGSKADVRFTSYDFSIYGDLKGEVTYISVDTTEDKDGKHFYEIRVRTDRNYLGSEANPLYIMPGMQASIRILTGKKSVLSYLLKPLIKARKTALTER